MSPLPGFVKSDSEDKKESKFFGRLKDGESVSFICLTGVTMPPEGEFSSTKNQVLGFDEYTLWKESPDGGFSPHFVKLSQGDGEYDLQGHEDPGVVLNLTARSRYLMLVCPVGESEPKVFSFTSSVFNQLKEFELGLGESIKGQVVKVSRKGSTKLNTKYRVIPLGKKVEIEGEAELDLIDFIGPYTYEGIIDLLTQSGDWPPKGWEEAKKPAKKMSKTLKASESDDYAYSEDE